MPLVKDPAGRGRRARSWMVLVVLCVAAHATAHAATFHVDAARSGCSDSGAGTEEAPFCSIGRALTGAGPGSVVIVHPAVYREQVNLTISGTSQAPLRILAPEGAVIDGADDYTSPENWIAVTENVRLATGVTWSPAQVFADGVRLTASAMSPAQLPPGSFRWIAGLGLLIHVGGGDLEGRQIVVGARAHGFRLTAVGHVHIEGFTIVRTEDRGLHVRSGSHNVTLLRNSVAWAGRFGMQLDNATSLLVRECRVWENADHGIHITGVTGSVFESNESFRNARPLERAAVGMMVRSSSQNTLRWNRLHHNQDSGMQIDTGSSGNVLTRNVSWLNGDHGFDHLQATGNVHAGGVAWGNFKDGFSVEGNSTGTMIYNAISAGNGRTSGRYNLFVDVSSTPGLQSDYNVFWNDGGWAPLRHGTNVFATLAGFTAATGLDPFSREMDPGFADPGNGSFRLLPGGPAIDAADSSVPGWFPIDAAGLAPFDDPGVPDAGTGPVPFADRGAYEYVGPGQPPSARLHVDHPAGSAPFTTVLDASASDDADDAIVSYTFDLGDGTVLGPQEAPTVTVSLARGVWQVSVLTKDEAGHQDVARTTLVVDPPNRPPDGAIQGLPPSVAVQAGDALTFLGEGFDPEGELPIRYLWDFGGAAAASSVPNPGPVTFGTPGSFDVRLHVTDARGLRDPSPALVRVVVSPRPTPDTQGGRLDRPLSP